MNQFILLLLACGLLSRLLILKSSAAAMSSLGQWMEWSGWSTCTERQYCLEGTRQRHRDCELGKTCIGVEAESEGCPDASCRDRPLILDIAHAEMHSFIAQECATSVKYYASGRYASLMKHDLTEIFPPAKSMLEDSFFNVKITKKTFPFEKDIYKYCFEPEIKMMTLDEFKNLIVTGTLRFKYASLSCPLPKPTDDLYVTGFAVGLEVSGKPYGIYVQVKTTKGFKSVYYKHMAGSYTKAYNLIWS